jgi:hypothetical protein
MNKDNSSLDYIRKKIEELKGKIDICNIFLKNNIRYFPDIFSIKDERDKSLIFQSDAENIKIINFNYIYSILPNPIIGKYKTIIPTPEILDIYKNQNLNFTYLNENLISIKTTPEEETKKIIEDLEHSCDYIKNLDIDKYYKSIIKELKQEIKEESKILQGFSNATKKGCIPQRTDYIDVFNNKQKGNAGDIDNEYEDKITSLISIQVDENKNLTTEEKKEKKSQIKKRHKKCDISEEINKTVGIFSKDENRAKRAISDIAYYALKERKIKSLNDFIPFEFSEYYKKYGIKKRKNGKYLYKEAKKSREILFKSILTKDIIAKVKIGYGVNKFIFTRFILSCDFDSTYVKTKGGGTIERFTRGLIKIDPRLFFNENINDISDCFMQDTDGYNDFLKINGTTIGDKLFLYIEPLLSPRNKKRELDLTTIINRLNLEKEYKIKKTDVKEKINRALDDMIKANTLIKDYEVVKGVNCQEKYILYNLRYKEKEVLENIKKIKSKTPKNSLSYD